MKYNVQFSATFEVEIDCEREELADEIANLHIPETDQTKYVYDTFEVAVVEDEDGNNIPVNEV